jgi:hypothetical protein
VKALSINLTSKSSLSNLAIFSVAVLIGFNLSWHEAEAYTNNLVSLPPIISDPKSGKIKMAFKTAAESTIVPGGELGESE